MHLRSFFSGSYSLRSLLPTAEVLDAEDVFITGCTDDWRKVRPGDAFIALFDPAEEDRRPIALAIQRGCAAVISDRLLSGLAVPVCLVSDLRRSFGQLIHQLTGHPSRKFKIVGVGGNRERTTTACLIAGVLHAANQRIGVIGSLGCLDGRSVLPSKHVPPPADKLAELLVRMVKNHCSHVVLEISDQAMAEERLAGMTLNVVCVSDGRELPGPSAVHAGRAKQARLEKIFDYLKKDGLVVLNADNPYSQQLLRRLDRPTLTVAVEAAAEITATPLEQSLCEQTFLLTAGSETVPVRTSLIGRDNIYNCLTAAAVGLSYGFELTTVVRGLESVAYVPGRLQRIECGQPFGVFLDCVRSAHALAKTLNTLRSLTAGRLICLLSTESLSRKHAARLPAVERYLDVAILTGSSPKKKASAMELRYLQQVFHRLNGVHAIPDRSAAMRFALSTAKAGDCVLICSDYRTAFRRAVGRVAATDDEEIVREWFFAHQFDTFANSVEGEKSIQ